jgi:hypothetical protein
LYILFDQKMITVEFEASRIIGPLGPTEGKHVSFLEYQGMLPPTNPLRPLCIKGSLNGKGKNKHGYKKGKGKVS